MSSIRTIQDQQQVNQESQIAKDAQKNETLRDLLATLGDSEDQSDENKVNQQKDDNNQFEIREQISQQNQKNCIDTDQQKELKSPINVKANIQQNQLEGEEQINSNQIQNDCDLQDQNQLSIEKVNIQQQNEDENNETDSKKLFNQNDEESYQKINLQNQQNLTNQQVHLQQQDFLTEEPQLAVSVQQEQNLDKKPLTLNETIANIQQDEQKNQEKLSENEKDFAFQTSNENNFKDEQIIINSQQNEIDGQNLQQEKTSNQIEQDQSNSQENQQILQTQYEKILFQQNAEDYQSSQNPDQAFNSEDDQSHSYQIQLDQLSEIQILEQAENSKYQKQETQDYVLQQKYPKYHKLQGSQSVEDLNLLKGDQINAQVKKSKKKKQSNASKKIIQRSELSNFLKKHHLVSSNSLSEQESQNNKLQKQIQQKNIEKQSMCEVKTQKPNLFPLQKRNDKKQIYRFCRDPYNQRFNQKILPKRKFFSILNLDLFKYNIELICSFLSDKDILKLRLVSRAFQPYLLRYFELEKQQATQKVISHKKDEILQIKNRINKSNYYYSKIKKLTEQINENISHLYIYLYFDKLDIKTLSVNEGKLLKLFYEALMTKPSIINSLQILNYCAKKEEISILFGNLSLSYDFMDKKLQQQFYRELQLIADFLKINNSAIIPSILENQIFTFSQEMVKKIENNIYIDKTYSSNILKGIYYWFELQLFYNQFLEKEPAFLELYKSQEQINYLRHTYEINNYLLRKII